MPDTPPLSPRLVGEAETALGALIAPPLAEAGLTFPQWVVLTLTAAAGPGVARDQLIAEAVAARKLDAEAVAAVIADLAAGGALAAQDGQVTLTAHGRAVFDRVRTRLAEITGYVFDLPAADLAVAGRVLSAVTARANQVLAAAR